MYVNVLYLKCSSGGQKVDRDPTLTLMYINIITDVHKINLASALARNLMGHGYSFFKKITYKRFRDLTRD